jgi:hypothetical protein
MTSPSSPPSGIKNLDQTAVQDSGSVNDPSSVVEELKIVSSVLFDESRDASVDAIERAIALLRHLMWQPMETAPKDGTRILAWSPAAARHGHFGMKVARWRTAQDDAGYIGWGEFNTEFWPPTHWMPLPQAPRSDDRTRASASSASE